MPGNLPAEEWSTMVELVRLIRASAPADAQALPSDLAPAIEEAVRAHFAPDVSRHVSIEHAATDKADSDQ
jgi:hypothetical protein